MGRRRVKQERRSPATVSQETKKKGKRTKGTRKRKVKLEKKDRKESEGEKRLDKVEKD